MAGETIRETEGRFNPAVPEVNPDTKAERMLSFSKGIRQPESDKSGMYALEGLGHALDTGAKTLNYAVERGIEENARPRIDAVRADYEARLDAATRGAEQGAGQPAVGPAPRPSLLSQVPMSQQVPDDLKNVERKAQVMDMARANGKITETDYYSRMDTLRKEFVNNYPGYTDYVDKTFEKFTGFNSANKLMASKVADYNALVATQKNLATEAEKWLIAHQHEDPNFAFHMRALRAGGDPIAIMADGNRILSAKFRMDFEKDRLALMKDNKEAYQDQAFRLSVQEASTAGFNRLNGILMDVGASQKMTIPQLLEAVQTGRIQMTPKMGEQLATLLEANRDGIYADLKRKWSIPLVDKDPHSPTYGQNVESPLMIMGQEKANQATQEGMSWFDHFIKTLRSGDSGLIGQAHRMWKAEEDGVINKLFNLPDGRGQYYKLLAAWNTAFHNSNPAESALLKTVRDSKPLDAEQASALIRAIGTDSVQLTPTIDPKVFTFSHALDLADHANLGGDAKRAVLDAIKLAQDDQNVPAAEQKLILNKAFSPYNAGMIKKIEEPEIQREMYKNWTTDANAEKVKKFADAGDHGLWANYKNWAGTEAYGMYQRNVINLNQAISRQKESGYTIGYDDVNHKFQITHADNFGLPPERPGTLRGPENLAIRSQRYLFAKTQIDKVNEMLHVQAKIAELEKSDPNESIVQFFKAPGLKGYATDMLLQGIHHTAFPLTEENAGTAGKPK